MSGAARSRRRCSAYRGLPRPPRRRWRRRVLLRAQHYVPGEAVRTSTSPSPQQSRRSCAADPPRPQPARPSAHRQPRAEPLYLDTRRAGDIIHLHIHLISRTPHGHMQSPTYIHIWNIHRAARARVGLRQGGTAAGDPGWIDQLTALPPLVPTHTRAPKKVQRYSP